MKDQSDCFVDDRKEEALRNRKQKGYISLRSIWPKGTTCEPNLCRICAAASNDIEMKGSVCMQWMDCHLNSTFLCFHTKIESECSTHSLTTQRSVHALLFPFSYRRKVQRIIYGPSK